MTTPDLSNASAEDLRSLIAAANERLEAIKQAVIEEAKAHGLTCVDGNGGKKPRRKASKHHED